MKYLLTFCAICFYANFLDAQSTLIRMSLFDETRYNNGDSAADGLIIVFEAGNNNGVDSFDAPKLFNLDESFARQNGSSLLSIERRDVPVDNETLEFYNINYRTQDYVFTIDAFQIDDVIAYLKDNYTGEIYEIGTGIDEVISFSIDNSIPESIDVNRFEISFIKKNDYIYDNFWTNLDPCVNSITAVDNLNVLSGNALIDCDMSLKNITVAAGAILQIASGNTITVHGDINNLGTIMAQNASIVINNESAFFSNNTQLGDFIIKDNNEIELSGEIDIYGNLLHTGSGSGIIDNQNAAITFKSTATSNSYYLPTKLQLTSPVISESYMSAGRAFRFVSSPVTSSISIFENWQENGNEVVVGLGTDITGATGTSGGFDLSSSNSPSMYSWDNISQAWIAQVSTNTSNDLINVGQPYRLFIRGDRQVDLTSNADSQRATTIRTTGMVQSGDFTPVISNVDGAFNMIGNPYIAPFDLDEILNNLDMSGKPVDAPGTRPAFFYVWDPTLQTRGAYVTYDTALDFTLNSSSQVNGYLQPYQVAFVIANGNSGDFTFKESYLDINQPHIQVTSITLAMRIELVNNNSIKDGVIIKFNDSFSNQFDMNDAPKISNMEENLSVLESQNQVSIAARKTPLNGEIIPLNISQLTTDTYEFQVAPVSFNAIDVYLKDNFTGQSTLLSSTTTTTYSFQYDNGNTQSSDASRFQIEFVNSILSLDESTFAKAISLYPNPSKDGNVSIQKPNDIAIESVEVYNAIGQQLMQMNTLSNNDNIDLSSLAKGVYIIELSYNGKTISKKMILD